MVEETRFFLEKEINTEMASEKVEPLFDPSQIEKYEEIEDAIIALEKFWCCEERSCLKQLIRKASLALQRPICINQDQDDDISVALDQVVCTNEFQTNYSITFSSDIYNFMRNHQNGALFMEYILKQELYKLIHPLANNLAYDFSDHYQKRICQELYSHLFAVNKITSPDLTNLMHAFRDLIQDESITTERREFCQRYYLILIAIRIFYDINKSIIKMDWIHLTATHPFSLEDLYAANEGYEHVVDILKLTLLNIYIDQCVGDGVTEKFLRKELLSVTDAACNRYQWSIADSLTEKEISNRLLSICVFCYACKVTESIAIADILGYILKFVNRKYDQYYPVSLTHIVISMLKEKWTNGIAQSQILPCISWLSKLLNDDHHQTLHDAILKLVIRAIICEHRFEVRSDMIKYTLKSLPNLRYFRELWSQLGIVCQYYMLKYMAAFDNINLINLRCEFKMQWCIKVIKHGHWSTASKAKAFIRVFTLFGNIWSDEFYQVIQHCKFNMIKDLLQEISEIVHHEKEEVINAYVIFLQHLAEHLSRNDNLLLLILRILSYLSRNSTKYQMIDYIGSYLNRNWQDKSQLNLVFSYLAFAIIHLSHTVISDSLNTIVRIADSMNGKDKKAIVLLAYYIAMRNYDQQHIEFMDQKYNTKQDGFVGKKLRKKVAKRFDLNKQTSSVESANVHENALFQEYAVFEKFITTFSQSVDQHGFYSACKDLLRN